MSQVDGGRLSPRSMPAVLILTSSLEKIGRRAKWWRPPEVAPGITRGFFIMVPTSELTSPKVTFASKPDTVWVPPAPTGRATCLTIFFFAPHADIGRITTNIGRISSFFQSVGYLSLRNGETVWVVAHHQQMTESQKTILAQGRVSVARSPGEFNSAFFFGHEEGVSFYLVVSDKGLPSHPKGGSRNRTVFTNCREQQFSETPFIRPHRLTAFGAYLR